MEPDNLRGTRQAMKRIIAILLLGALIAGGSFYYTASQKDVRAAVSPLTGPAVQAVYASGTVEPTVMMPIAPRSGARLLELLADEGAEVKKDDVLARLEDTDLQKSAEELKARLDLAQKEFDRKNNLRKTGAVSKQAIDTAQTTLEAAKAALAQVEAQISYLRLVAPADGRIIRRDGEVGQFIPSGQPVFYMECCAPLRVSVDVDEEDIPLLVPGQKVILSADAFPGQTFSGAVISITPKGDPVARSYRVRLSIEGETPLMTGMTAEANILIRENPEALLIPATALRDNTVWAVRDGKIEKMRVKTGAQSLGGVEILEGIGADETILEKADPSLETGNAVKIYERKWSPEK